MWQRFVNRKWYGVLEFQKVGAETGKDMRAESRLQYEKV